VPRGGRRSGAPGQAYPNRTDLTAAGNKAQPIAAAPGQPYGAAKAQTDAMRAMPLPNAQAADASAVMQAARNFDLSANAAPPLHRPTERPTEPVTAGAPLGPGPGPETLGTPPGMAPASLADMLNSLAPDDPSGGIAALASQAQALGQ
jgi:hypothetical protein